MALMTDKYIKKKLEDRLKEVSEYGMTIYYLLEDERTSINDLESIFFSNDDEKASFIYSKIIRRMKPQDIVESFKKYSEGRIIEDESNDKKNLNIEYTKKLLDLTIAKSHDVIDKTYINTYNYLITNITNK